MVLRALLALVVGLSGLAWAARAQEAAAGSHFKNGLIFVDVQVNGAAGVFLLDTGAAASVFDPRFAEAAGVRLGRPRQIEGRGGDVAARQGQAVQLALTGGAQARIEPVVADLSEASSAMGVTLAGILGEDFLQGFVLTLNYRDQSVSIAGGAADPVDATPIRFGSTPYVTARVQLGGRNVAGDFEIDTGSNTAIEFLGALRPLGARRCARDPRRRPGRRR